MYTVEEVLMANNKLRKMILKRKKGKEYLELGIKKIKDEIAQNVIELQKQANNLNPHL